MTIRRLSVLDQSVAIAGRAQAESIRETITLAKHCEDLGYSRFWVAEHHNHDTITGSAPEIVMSAIGATTERIRIGSAGIMLPHYSALKVAEQFRVSTPSRRVVLTWGSGVRRAQMGARPTLSTRTRRKLQSSFRRRCEIYWPGLRAVRYRKDTHSG